MYAPPGSIIAFAHSFVSLHFISTLAAIGSFFGLRQVTHSSGDYRRSKASANR